MPLSKIGTFSLRDGCDRCDGKSSTGTISVFPVTAVTPVTRKAKDTQRPRCPCAFADHADKLQAQNKKVVEEFDRAKQRMYKRYERALDPNKKASKRDLSYAEYYEWLENATEARDAYLAGKLSEKDALKVIREDFVNRDKM